MLSIIFYILKWVCKMKGDDYKNKRMIFKRHVIAYCWTLRTKDKLNMKQEGFPMLTVGAEWAFQVK